MSFIRFAFVVLFSLMFSMTGWSKPIKPTDLQGYIKKNCPKNCVAARTLNTVVKQQAKKHKVDKHIIMAIVRVESSFNVKAKGSGSVGLTQVMPRWHRAKFKGGNYYQVNNNISAGTQVYQECNKKTKGNIRRALACYNGGGDRRYVPKVMKAYAEIKHLRMES